MRKKLLCILIILTFLCGCIPSQQLEHLGIIYAGGIDTKDKDKVHLTAVIHQFQSESNNATKIVSGKARTLKGAVKNANLETNFRLATGKVQLDIFGLDTAKRGIGSYIDALARDATIPDTMLLAVSQTTARDLLMVGNKGISINSGQFLHDTIERNTRDQLFPIMTLTKFQSRMFDVGRDPILPMFELQKDNVPRLTSIALFKDAHYVGKLSMNDKYMINLLEKRIREERFEVAMPANAFKKVLRSPLKENEKEIDMLFELVNGKGDIDVKDMDKLQFTANIKMNVTLMETEKELDLKSDKTMKTVQKELQKTMEKKYEKMLHDLQQLNVDILGFGDVYRAHKRGDKLTKSKWRRLYPDIKVKFNIDVKMVGHGELS